MCLICLQKVSLVIYEAISVAINLATLLPPQSYMLYLITAITRIIKRGDSFRFPLIKTLIETTTREWRF